MRKLDENEVQKVAGGDQGDIEKWVYETTKDVTVAIVDTAQAVWDGVTDFFGGGDD